ncbi:toprim domain-containing protein [Shewanella dokdonensis]|uniref:toprim domain-containing protein n=1 Tax=Shewanella dokdonensis TaxID=712036 RepID=UPI00200F38B4|nr:toprim domain-containing protein [Shewanella dokdonensis]MCL1076480.1 toprim domain-containing protein [Shewanella dokdonensis]
MMYPELLRDVTPRLLQEFDFKISKDGKHLQQGICPACRKRELYTQADNPWLLRCGRLNKCGEVFHIKELYPDLFNSWSERFPVNKTDHNGQQISNPNAAADAYLEHGRGFDIEPLKGWYSQGSYYDGKKDIGTATVRFTLPCGASWERFIDKPERFGKQKANFVGSYQGHWWLPPTLTIEQLALLKELWLTEGIFDAIALLQNDQQAGALMSCNNFPDKALEELALRLPANTRPTLIFALDDGKAGEMFTRKFVKRARELGWRACAAQPPKGRVKLDWNELHQRERLTAKDREEYRYLGKLLIAPTANAKALLIHQRKGTKEFPFGFNSCLYWFKLDLDRFSKAMQQVADAADRDGEELTDEELRERALQEAGSVQELAWCYPQALYFQENKVTDESWYYFRVDFPHDEASVKNTFSGSQLSGAGEFKKRLLSIAPGAVYHGNTQQLDRLLSHQLYNIKRVETCDFIGYSKEHGCYVYADVAVKDGRLYQLNEEDFFDIGKLSVKSLNSAGAFSLNTDFKQLNQEWFRHLWTAFGPKGLVALSFWFGSFYAEQIRHEHKSYPFLEIYGEPGTGKSTLIEFLWKLAGRSDYEGFDPNKATVAGRARNFAQVSNMPVVLIEGDRGNDKDAKQKGFDFDELKTLYNGRGARIRGLKNSGNETYEPPFRGAVVIAQNAEVNASEAILQRIVQIGTDRNGHNQQTKEAAQWLERIPTENVSGFILKCALAEAKVLHTFNSEVTNHEQWLASRGEIKNVRIIKNHAQLCALMDAMRLVLDIHDEQIKQTRELIYKLALDRQLAINADHPLVQEFWDVVDYLESDTDARVNHSRDQALIAINLNHFVEEAENRRQRTPPLADLKRLLKSCRSHKFIGVRTVNSAVNTDFNRTHPLSLRPTSVKCWVFEQPK